MRGFSLTCLMLILTGALRIDAQEMIIKTKPIITISQFGIDDFYFTDEPGNGRAWPWFDAKGNFGAVLKSKKIYLFGPSFNKIAEESVIVEQFDGPRFKVESRDLCVFTAFRKYVVFRLGDRYTTMELDRLDDEYAILAWGRLLLGGTRISGGMSYRGYLFDDDGGYRVLEDKEVVPWLLGQSKAFSYRDGVLYYGIANLKTSVHGFDDDMNLYWALSLYSPDGPRINFEYEKKDLGYLFDFEGNFWQIGWTEDKAKHPILYYAGRDWGYREPPKKAVTTEAGLRIRLRASTDAFVLGSLGKGEAITILKIGETATIGGVTAPWYRIKKADGLIGWAFGGYIKVVE